MKYWHSRIRASVLEFLPLSATVRAHVILLDDNGSVAEHRKCAMAQAASPATRDNQGSPSASDEAYVVYTSGSYVEFLNPFKYIWVLLVSRAISKNCAIQLHFDLFVKILTKFNDQCFNSFGFCAELAIPRAWSKLTAQWLVLSCGRLGSTT